MLKGKKIQSPARLPAWLNLITQTIPFDIISHFDEGREVIVLTRLGRVFVISISTIGVALRACQLNRIALLGLFIPFGNVRNIPL